MLDACYWANEPVEYGRCNVSVMYDKLKGHPGTLAASAFWIGGDPPSVRCPAESALTSVRIFCHSPRIFIADHAFAYQLIENEMQEGARALRACEGNRRIGTFRADSHDIGCCFRTGWRQCVYEIEESKGHVRGTLLESSVEADDNYNPV